uniref:Oocyte secreted protein 1 n=1 Tax=Nannospalax galili TaxID=1026970 RepID=A0A8C6RK86_NANGA
MKTFLGLWGLSLLSFTWTHIDDWSAYQLQCTNHWFYLRIRATLFPYIHMDPDEVFLGADCPVTQVWPNDYYDFTYRTYSCGIVNKVIHDVTLLQTKIKYISKNSTLRAEMHLSCVLHSRYPLICEAECRGNFTGNPPEWTVDMTTQRTRCNEAAPSVQPNLSTSTEDHQLSKEFQASRTFGTAEASSFMDYQLPVLCHSRMQ